MNDILVITVLTVNPTVLPVYSGKLFKELFLQKKEKVFDDAVANDERDTSIELTKVPLKLSLHSLSQSSPKKSNDNDIRENEEYAEADLTLLTGFPELKIVHVKPLKTESSNKMAKKFITNNDTIHHAKFQKCESKINGNREIFVSKLSLGHIGLMKVFANVSMNVLDNIHSLIPDLGLVTPKGPTIRYIFFTSLVIHLFIYLFIINFRSYVYSIHIKILILLFISLIFRP